MIQVMNLVTDDLLIELLNIPLLSIPGSSKNERPAKRS